MIPIFGEWALFWLGFTIGLGYVCVRSLEFRDIRRVVRQENEHLKRHPQMRLFR
jgi:hypothetical protein